MKRPMTDAEVVDLILYYVSRPLALPVVMAVCLAMVGAMVFGEGLGL